MVRFGQLGPDAQLDWKIPRYQWHATVVPLFSLPSAVPFTPMSYDFLHSLTVIIPTSSRPLCPAVPFCLFLTAPETLGAGNAHPRQACCHTSETHTCTRSCSSPVSPFLQCSAPCSDHPAQDVLLCSVTFFPIGPLFFKALKKIARGKKKNPAFTVLLKIFFFSLSPAMQGLY